MGIRMPFAVIATIACALMVLCATSSRADDIQLSASEVKLRTTTYTYDAVSRTTRNIDPGSGRVTVYTYESNATDQVGATTSTYDDVNRTTPTYDGGGNVLSYSYDDKATVDGTTYPDSSGSSGSESDGTYALQYQYDSGTGNDHTSAGGPAGNTTTYTYETNFGSSGVAQTDADGNVTRYQYDALNRDIKSTETLNDGSRVDGTIDLNGLTTRYQYDARGTVVPNAMGSGTIQLEDTTTHGIVFRYDYNYNGGSNSYGGGVGTPTIGSFTGYLEAGDTYRYTYSYDVGGAAGSADFHLFLSAVPLPSSLGAGAVLLVGLALRRRGHYSLTAATVA